MALHFNKHDVSGVYYGRRVVTAIYHGLQLVWSAASKFWRGKQAWSNREIWKY